MNKLSLFLFMLVLPACRTQVPVTQVPVETKTTIVERLVPVSLPGDSAHIKALFECDSMYNVLLHSVSENKGIGFESIVSFEKGELSYQVVKVPQTVYLPAKDSVIYKEIPVVHNIPVEVNRLTRFQSFLVICGWAFLAIVFLTGVILLVRWKLR